MTPHRCVPVAVVLVLLAVAVALPVAEMVEKDYWVFARDGSTLTDTGHRVKVSGGPVGIRAAEK